MRTVFFKNFDEFERANVAGKYETTAIVINDKRNTMCADLMTDCKNYKTALKRFFKSLKDYPQFDGWEETITESCNNKIWEGKEYVDNKYTGGYFWEVQDNDGSFYICLNVMI